MPRTALVTGASGFIGRAIVTGLAQQGWAVAAASRRPVVGAPAHEEVSWSLGQPLPIDLSAIEVLIHCASATITATGNLEQACALDIAGSRILIEQCRAAATARANPILFVFVSSQSAGRQAANTYGRSKYAIEQLLTEPAELIVRPGLVYDKARTGVYGTAVRLLHLTRLLPRFGGTHCIQPIHIDDLVGCFVRIAERRPAGALNLGSETALDFAEFCRLTARREGLPAPIFVPLVGTVARATLALAASAGLLTSLHERVEGLLALNPMPTTESLAKLDMRLRDF